MPYELVEIVRDVSRGVRKVTITGGEPLEQDWAALQLFIKLLVEEGFVVTIETSGTQNTVDFRRGIKVPYLLMSGELAFVVDYKLSSSHFRGKMDLENHFLKLDNGDVIKFVIDNVQDFDEARLVAKSIYHSGRSAATMYFSPSHGNMNPARLFGMMITSDLPAIEVGINMQMHKYIWTEDIRAEENYGVDFTRRTLGREEYLKSTRETGNG